MDWSMPSWIRLNVDFHGISTTLSHESAYTILEGLRRKMTDKLMKAPLGTVINQPIGQLKTKLSIGWKPLSAPLLI